MLVPGGEPADEAMAFITLVRCHGDRRMIPGLADRQTPVMAVRAGAPDNANVVPARRDPGHRSVALIAGSGSGAGRVVTDRPPRRLAPVVAYAALPGPHRAVIEARPQKCRSIEVATFTGRISRDVLAGFRRCDNAAAKRMTTVTIPRRALEHAACVTGFTRCRGMSARKQKTGARVVEIAAHLRFRCGVRCDEKKKTSQKAAQSLHEWFHVRSLM